MILTNQMVLDYIGDREVTVREIVKDLYNVDETIGYWDYLEIRRIVSRHLATLAKQERLSIRKSDICVDGSRIAYYSQRRERCAYSTHPSTLTIQNRRNSISSEIEYYIA